MEGHAGTRQLNLTDGPLSNEETPAAGGPLVERGIGELC